MTAQVPHITTTDIYAFNDDYVSLVRNEIVKKPGLKMMVFTIYTDSNNLNSKFSAVKTKQFITDITIELSVDDIISKYKTPKGATKAILKKVFEAYKQNLNLQ